MKAREYHAPIRARSPLHAFAEGDSKKWSDGPLPRPSISPGAKIPPCYFWQELRASECICYLPCLNACKLQCKRAQFGRSFVKAVDLKLLRFFLGKMCAERSGVQFFTYVRTRLIFATKIISFLPFLMIESCRLRRFCAHGACSS